MATGIAVKSTRRLDGHRLNAVLLVGFVVLAVAVTAFLAVQVIEHRDFPFDNDEAAHAVPALLMSYALRQGDALGFVREVYGQNFYPPGASVFLIPAYLLFGPSVTAARLASVVALLLSLIVLMALAREIDRQRGTAAGLLAVALMVVARPLLTTAGLVMLETPGLLASLLLLWAYVRSTRSPSAARLLLVGVLLAAVFLTKYSYGLVALAAVGLNELLDLRRATACERLLRRWQLMFGPFALLLAVWFIRPGQTSSFLDYTQPLAEGEAWLSATNVLYYLRSFTIHTAPSPLFAVVNLAALVWAASRRRDAAVRVLLLYFLLGMASVMLVNHPPNPRFIATFAPAAQLMTGLMLVRLWPVVGHRPAGGRRANGGRRADRRRWDVNWRFAAITAVVLAALASLPEVAVRVYHYDSLLEARLETSPELAEMGAWVGETVPADGPVYLVNPFDQFGPGQVSWEMAQQLDARPPAVAFRVLDPATPQTTAAVTEEIDAAEATALVLIEGGPWGAPFWPDYSAALGDRLEEIGRRSFALDSYNVSGWLDENTLSSVDWEALMSESRQEMEIGVIVYRVRP